MPFGGTAPAEVKGNADGLSALGGDKVTIPKGTEEGLPILEGGNRTGVVEELVWTCTAQAYRGGKVWG